MVMTWLLYKKKKEKKEQTTISSLVNFARGFTRGNFRGLLNCLVTESY